MLKLLKKIFPSAPLAEKRNDIADHQTRGNALLADGKLEAAATCYRSAISLNPNNVDGYVSLGYVLMQLQCLPEAELVLQKAITLDPRKVDTLYMLATLARGQRDTELAIDYFNRILTIKPDFEPAFGELCELLIESGRAEEAKAMIQRGIALYPKTARFHFILGNLYNRARQYEQAEASFKQALATEPDRAELHFHLAAARHAQGKLPHALESYRSAIALDPDHELAHSAAGAILLTLGHPGKALASLDRALQLNPDNVDALMARGAILSGYQRLQEALQTCEQVIRLRPHSPQAYLNQSAVLQNLCRYDEALVSCRKALQLKPNYADALVNQGTTLTGLNRHEEALASHQRARELIPDDADASYNESLCRLTLGDFEGGWKLHESRWGVAQFKTSKRHFPQPLWLGKESLQGKSILLHAEQGLGDTIQFCRYVKQVTKLGATVTLLVQKPLQTLLSGIDGASKIISDSQPLPLFDYHCPLLSLPLALGTTLDTVPAAVPYLCASDELTSRIRDELEKSTGSFKIGICWKGSAAYPGDAKRSPGITPFKNFMAGSFTSEVKFYALLPNSRDVFREMGGTDLGYELDGNTTPFAETAALIMNLDLVITSDTSIAHLAGALGKPTWIVLPFSSDWRWVVNRDDSVWYPSIRLFRQITAGNWAEVFERVAVRLNNVLAGVAEPLWPVDFQDLEKNPRVTLPAPGHSQSHHVQAS